jgi:putative DNA primase/helicase
MPESAFIPFWAEDPGVAGRLARIEARLKGVKKQGDGRMALCPSHDDRNPSLSIKLADNGKVLVHCFAGCPPEEVMAALDLPMSLLAGSALAAAPANRPRATNGRNWAAPDLAAAALAKVIGSVEASYCYRDLDGTSTYTVVRFRTPGGKTFRPLHLTAGRWHVGDPDRLLPLYRLPEIITERAVMVVEGEKCVDAAMNLGIAATTSAHGANSAGKTDWTRLEGKRVVLCPDADQPGRDYVKEVAGILRTIDPDADIALLELPGLSEGEDIADYVERLRAKGLSDAEIQADVMRLVDAAPAWSQPDGANIADCAPFAPGGAITKWPAPRPIAEQVLLPKFPIDTAFPKHLGRLKDFVVATADCYQVPVDAVALLALPIMALGLSKRFEVEPIPGWREQLSIYSLVLLPSGERETAVMQVLLSPIYAWQRETATGMADAIRCFDNQEQVVRERLDRARKKAAKSQACDDGIDDLSEELAKIEREKPRPPSLVVSDGTTEAIARSLVLNNERTLLAAAEGDAIDIMLGRYSGTPNFGVWLSGHSGDAVDSIRRGREPDRLTHPALQVALCVQPEAVLDLLGSQAAQGRGVVPRFFIIQPESKVGFRELMTKPIPPNLVDYFGTRIQSHLEAPVPSNPFLIRFTPEALDLFTKFRVQNEIDLRPDGDLASIKAWGSKLPGAIARVAGLLQAFEPTPPLEVDIETIRCALSLAPYLTQHYSHVGAIGSDHATVNLAQRIDRWFRRAGTAHFTRRDAFNQVKALAKRVEAIDPALELLEERHRIAKAPSRPPECPGRPPGPTYLVNPALISSTGTPEQKEHNPQNSCGGGPR